MISIGAPDDLPPSFTQMACTAQTQRYASHLLFMGDCAAGDLERDESSGIYEW